MELLIILSSLLIAAAVCLVAQKRIIIESVSVIATVVAFLGAAFIARTVTLSGPFSPYRFFSIDELAAIIMLIITLVGMATTAYSVRYLREECAKQIIGFTQVKQFYILLNLFLAAMLFAVTSSNPIFTWISIEATTLSTAFLISFYNKPHSIEAAWKYLIINSIGLLLGFFGTLLFFTSMVGMKGAEFTTWDVLLANVTHFNPTIAKIAFVFVLIGYGTKVGLAPMHTWLPDAHSKAPVPISALLSGVLLNVAFIAILRFKVIADAVIGPAFSQKLLIAFGLLSILVAALIILTQKNYKRLLAYSSIENMGIIALGFGIGRFGIFAALLHMIYHALTKSALFLTAGNVFLKYSSTKIARIQGMIAALPVTGVLFTIGLFAITGTPPCGIFFTKFYILSAGIQTHPVVTVIALFSVALVFVGFLRHAVAMLFGEKPPEVTTGERGGMLLIAPTLLLAIVLYISFHIPSFLSTLLHEAASHF
jgi:hydrogenase-4 component F